MVSIEVLPIRPRPVPYCQCLIRDCLVLWGNGMGMWAHPSSQVLFMLLPTHTHVLRLMFIREEFLDLVIVDAVLNAKVCLGDKCVCTCFSFALFSPFHECDTFTISFPAEGAIASSSHPWARCYRPHLPDTYSKSCSRETNRNNRNGVVGA